MHQLSDYNVTVEELAAKLGYTTQRIRTLAQEQKLPALKRFRRWMFCEGEVMACLRNNNPVAGNGQTQTMPKRSIVNDTRTDKSDSVSDILR